MPTYESECRTCGKYHEYMQSIADRNQTPECCGSPTTRGVFTPPMGFVQFPAAGGQGYVSHTSGKWIDTKRARDDDLKRTGCRPWEGIEQETKQKAKNDAHEEKKADAKLDADVRKAYAELSPDKKATLNNNVP